MSCMCVYTHVLRVTVDTLNVATCVPKVRTCIYIYIYIYKNKKVIFKC